MSRPLPFVLLLIAGIAQASSSGSDEAERWFESDWEERTAAVNEGALEFLPAIPAGEQLHSRNWITITPASLAQGWVALRQCHENLDPVPDLEVVYRYRAMRGLRIQTSEHIGAARVVDTVVQLQDLARGARLCVEAEVQLLRFAPDGRVWFQSGPYHRRFLDGYYPMHVAMHVAYPRELLEFVVLAPTPRPGLVLTDAPGRLSIDAWAVGELTLGLEFIRRADVPQALQPKPSAMPSADKRSR